MAGLFAHPSREAQRRFRIITLIENVAVAIPRPIYEVTRALRPVGVVGRYRIDTERESLSGGSKALCDGGQKPLQAIPILVFSPEDQQQHQ